MEINYIQSPECLSECGSYHSPIVDTYLGDIRVPTDSSDDIGIDKYAKFVWEKWLAEGGDDEFHMARGITFTEEMTGIQVIYRFTFDGALLVGKVQT